MTPIDEEIESARDPQRGHLCGDAKSAAGEVKAGALADLIERVAAATEGSRELDAEIAVALSGDAEAWVVNPAPRSIFSAVPGWWRDSADKSHCAPELTASLDAALALVERVLPDADLGLRTYASGYPALCQLWPGEEPSVFAHGATPALALILAMLRAVDGAAGRPALPREESENPNPSNTRSVL